jgi:hypothetical protein
MRKVLLATTALVAMSVSAAQADITISGVIESNYNNDGTTSSMGQDGNITLTSTSVTDSGLTAKVVANMGIQGTTMNMEDSYLELSGDFGTIRTGATDLAGDVKDGVLGKNKDVYSFGVASVTTALVGTDVMDNDNDTSLSYFSPSINGLQVYGSTVIDKEQIMGINYSFGGFDMMYQNASKAGQDENSIGVGFSMAGVSVNMGKKREKTVSTTTNSSDLNLKYSVSDALTVSYLIQKGKQGSTKNSTSGLEAAYSIAPGITAYVGLNNADDGTTSDDSTGFAIEVSF